jgi:hypothetical protein
MIWKQNDDNAKVKVKDRQKAKTAYLEIFRNLEEGRMRYNCYLDDILEREVKYVTT